MTTLKGIFPDLKPTRRKNFIHENVKNLHRMKKCFHTNGGVEEIRKSHIHNQKKANSNTHLRNCNHIEDILPKKINTVLHVKQHENMTKGTANNKSDHQQELCKKSNVPALNKTTTCTKKVMRLHNNNLSVKQKKEDHKHLHNSIKRLHGKMLSRPNLSYMSIRDVNKNVKHQSEVKSQGIQTLNTTEIDSLYSEGIIKYPSKKYLNSNESINNDNRDEQIDKLSNDVINLSLKGEGTEFVEKTMQNQNDLKDPKILTSKEGTDFIKSNKEHSVTTNNVVTETKNNTNNPNNVKNGKYNNINNNNFPTANYRMGVVPKYIKVRKETQEKIQKAKTEEVDVNCPQGHVPLPDHERKETLSMLRKNYQDYVNELNMLPIKADTLRAQRRKIEIEKQLNKLEEGIKVFSRPKVYVKMNA